MLKTLIYRMILGIGFLCITDFAIAEHNLNQESEESAEGATDSGADAAGDRAQKIALSIAQQLKKTPGDSAKILDEIPAEDLDSVIDALRNDAPSADLTGDGKVDDEDKKAWQEALAQTQSRKQTLSAPAPPVTKGAPEAEPTHEPNPQADVSRDPPDPAEADAPVKTPEPSAPTVSSVPAPPSPKLLVTNATPTPRFSSRPIPEPYNAPANFKPVLPSPSVSKEANLESFARPAVNLAPVARAVAPSLNTAPTSVPIPSVPIPSGSVPVSFDSFTSATTTDAGGPAIEPVAQAVLPANTAPPIENAPLPTAVATLATLEAANYISNLETKPVDPPPPVDNKPSAPAASDLLNVVRNSSGYNPPEVESTNAPSDGSEITAQMGLDRNPTTNVTADTTSGRLGLSSNAKRLSSLEQLILFAGQASGTKIGPTQISSQ
jgi:hypothetical protein